MAMAAFSQSTSTKPRTPKPSSKEVVVVMKITVKTNINRDFIADTRGVKDKTKPDTFCVYTSNKNYVVTDFEEGKYGFLIIKKDNNIGELEYAEYDLFGDKAAGILIPLNFSFKIPSDAKAVYLGNFVVTVNENYEITDINRYDEYEVAQKELDEEYKSVHYDLVRIEDLYAIETKK